MRSPLNKRIFREIRGEAGKYVVIFLFMVAIISVASGYFIGDASLKKAYDDSFGTYHVEGGHFELPMEADEALIDAIEEEDVTVYPDLYVDEPSVGDSKIRLFSDRTEVNKPCLLDGEMPNGKNEVALDRLYMKSNAISMGEEIRISGKTFHIVGMVALPDYSALYENNSDFMFDTEKFGVGIVTQEAFDAFGDNHLHYSYAWTYDQALAERFGQEAIDRSDDFVEALSQKTMLLNYVPTVRNSAIRFAGNDLGHDRIMMIVMLDMLIVIIAFVFAVTTSNTITKEANVIGTLRASGYTRGELILHYMAAPLVVLLIASVIGNLLGYTVLKGLMADMYLGSYSLVSYQTLWNGQAFIDTTVIPLLILAAINYVMLAVKLSLSPLKFLRRDLKRHQRKKAFKLNTKIGIMKRFRMRVLFQNISGYITIFIGIFFASVIMIFSMLFAPLLDRLETDTIEQMISSHQYILKAPAETETKGAEKFAAGDLKIINKDFSESVSIYGISEDSQYFHTDIAKDTVLLSSAYADKYQLKAGDSITLYDEYSNEAYHFDIDGIYPYPSTLAVFMELSDFNKTFDLDEDSYSGYFSNEEITDIDEAYIAADITKEDLTKTTRQLKRSMGNMMGIFLVLGVAVIVLVVYMLSKVIIEKNTQSISVTKILGYEPKEISAIYIRTTTIVTLLSMVLCMPLVSVALDALWRAMMMQYSGWMAPVIPASAYIKTIALAAATYFVTSLILRRKINRIPMDEALKNVE